jgi:hypothetical protein
VTLGDSSRCWCRLDWPPWRYPITRVGRPAAGQPRQPPADTQHERTPEAERSIPLDCLQRQPVQDVHPCHPLTRESAAVKAGSRTSGGHRSNATNRLFGHDRTGMFFCAYLSPGTDRGIGAESSSDSRSMPSGSRHRRTIRIVNTCRIVNVEFK